ncbi:hypothetical protein FM106_23045 [Brachybacterium faecium]|nr:hypothetical protein FM106_23045 [Brachybacterium faecium]
MNLVKERLQAALDLRYKNNGKSNEMLVELVKKISNGFSD